MQDSDRRSVDLYVLLEKLNNEADKCIAHIETIRKKGTNAFRKAESVLTPSIRLKIENQARQCVSQLTERLVEINCDLELETDDDQAPNLIIPFISTGNSSITLKFLTGDNPWNFSLVDDKVDTKTLHKNLWKKYQNDLLDPHPNPKPTESICYLERSKVFRGIVIQAIHENRVRIVDCDSNVSKVVSSDKLFKADPDACHTHASALRCTISKDSVCSELWNTELRDVFCDALKEAVLHVKVLERLPGNIPNFLVDVEMQSEDEKSVGNLKEWIVDRLLPELRKLTADDKESLCDFLSSEALDPYHTWSDVKSTVKVTDKKDECELDKFVEEPGSSQKSYINNLNKSPTDKISTKVVSNIDGNVLSPKNNDSGISISNTEERSVCSSDSGNEIPSTNTKPSGVDTTSKIVQDSKLSHCSQEFTPNPANVPPVDRRTPMNIHAGFPPHYHPPYHYPKHQPIPCHPYSQHIPPQYPTYARPMAPQPWIYQGVPLHQVHNSWNRPPPPSTSPGYHQQWPVQSHLPLVSQSVSKVRPPTQWSSGETFKQGPETEESDENLKISNINNINVNVNVMAQEFVPKNSSEPEENVNKLKSITDPGNATIVPQVQTAPNTVHIELRKPRSLLSPGDNLPVLIAHVVSPSEFYVHFMTENNKYLDTLHNDMFTHYTATKEKVIYKTWREAKSALGKFCACKWLEDNHWYRVEVLDWALGDNKVKVFFVDYGNSDSVPLSCIQPLVQKYSKLSMCAQACHLAQVHPLNKSETWSEESIEFFKSKVEVSNTRIYSVTVVPPKQTKIKINSLSVLLYVGAASVDILSINEEMVDCGTAWSRKLRHKLSSESDVSPSLENISLLSDSADSSTDSKLKKPVPAIQFISGQQSKNTKEDEWETWDPQSEEYFSARNNPAIDTDDAGVALIGYQAMDEARICKFYYQKGFCPKVVCSKEHSMPNKDGVTTDKEEVYLEAFTVIDIPSIGEIIQVKVTEVTSISLFYVQLQEIRGIGMNNDEDQPQTLTTLHNFMNNRENLLQMKGLRVPPALGQLVLAKYENQFFRSRVITSTDLEEEVEVMFVDFGNICTVPEKDLREMEPCYLHLPFQAIECSIANVNTPATGSKKFQEGTDWLKENILNCVLTAKVYDRPPNDFSQQMEVLIRDEELGDIGEQLIEMGYCTERRLNWHLYIPSKNMLYYPG